MFDWMVFRTSQDPAAHLPVAARGVLGDLGDDQIGWARATLRDNLARKA